MYRRAEAVAYGVGIGLGIVTPPEEYWESITDGKGEAMCAKAGYELGRKRD